MRGIEQLRRDLEEAIADLSPAARSVWEALEAHEARMESGEEPPIELPPGYDDLLPSEQDALGRVLQASAEVHAAAAEESAGMFAGMRQAADVIRRAQELEPGLGDEITLGEAMAILERHGESSGLSPELADMVVEVPTQEPTKEEADAMVQHILDSLSPQQRRVLNIRMQTRGEDENAGEILGEVQDLSEAEAQEHLDEIKKLVEDVVNEVVEADEQERRREERSEE